ncbi:MAG: AMP-binding protein [Candidatus Dormibacteraeota bacterium]|nr:AMP-binding protein [Candidatus Dormibacteraeota bacterium]MBO0760795.1 AMP-binding protein [Candidatus Dormibacteraeota bacterium]
MVEEGSHDTARSLPHLIEHTAARCPESCALAWEGVTVTYARLARESAQAAAGLRRLGFRRGDRLALWLPNRPEWITLLLAAARLGVVAVAVNTRYRGAELAHVLRVSGARGVAVQPGFLELDFVGILKEPDVPPVEHVIAVGERSPDGCEPYATLLEHGRLTELGEPDDGAAVFTTSGTTASPKLAVHDQAGCAQHARAVASCLGLGDGDAMLCSLPLCGVFGFSGALAALAAGARLVLQDPYEADAAARLLAEHRVTHFYGPDTMLRSVLASPAFDAAGSRWRWGGFANFTGASLELLREAEAQAGIPLVGLYGSSEGFALLSMWRQDQPPEERALGGGYPVGPEFQVRAGDPETGEPLGHDQDGELQLRGPNVAREYLANEEATRAARTPDGWFRTGDLGHTRADGSFVYLARLKDSLRVRGYLVDPAEIEEHLQRHPAVEVAQVVGVRRHGEGDLPVAFVRLRAGSAAEPSELLEHCRSSIAGYKVPRALEVVDAFPVTGGPNGDKIQKVRLRQMAEEVLGQHG